MPQAVIAFWQPGHQKLSVLLPSCSLRVPARRISRLPCSFLLFAWAEFNRLQVGSRCSEAVASCHA